jgi:excisionase family DNA binding protein
MQTNILTVSELAEYLKLSRAKVYQMAQRGELPGTKLGTHWRFRKDLIDRWLEEQMIRNHQEIDNGSLVRDRS